MSLGDERTLGDGRSGQETVIDDIEVVDLDSRYRIEGTLGQGGMGSVLLATDTRLGRKVAIKRILGEAAGNRMAVQRFLTEAKSTAALNHPNIVQIYDYGRAKDGPFLVMEYVDGGSLLDRCRESALPLDEAIDLACQLCDGLAKAHDLGIIHRDIKPANVLLTKDGMPKLTDFGLAKAQASDHGQTMTGAVLGTPDFMPPEQRRDASEVDTRSDLWSLAATIYQMVTGRSPKIIRFKDVPESIQEVLGKALEDRKDSRYQTARELRDALKTSLLAKASAAVSDVLEGKCPACGVQNDPSRKFCRGCGESLEAVCLSCDMPMPMWEEICGSCGGKQTALIDDRRRTMAARQAEAEGLLGDFEFDRAIGIATLLRDEAHPRLQYLADWAVSFLEQIEKSRAEQTRHAVEAMAEAGKHVAEYDYLSAMFVLEMVPNSLRAGVLPGMRESAGAMLGRIKKTQGEASSLEARIKERLAAKQLDELLPDVEKLATLRPDRKDLQKIRAQLIERQQKQAGARDTAIELAKASLASHDYEAALAGVSGVAPAMITPEVIALREQAESLVRQVRELAGKIKAAVTAKQFDGLLDVVQKYLTLKPADVEVGKLRQSLVEREEKYAADIAARLQQAEQLVQACRFDDAMKLLMAIPKPRRSKRVAACLGRASRLGPMRRNAITALGAATVQTYQGAIETGRDYAAALAADKISDAEFAGLLARTEAAQAQAARSRRTIIVTGAVAAGVAVVVTMVTAGLWIRSSMRAASLASAIAQSRWEDALAIEPESVAALVGRAKARLAASPADFAGVFADLDRAGRQPGTAESVKPVRADAHAWRAITWAEANELDQAAQDLRLAKDGGASAAILTRAQDAIAKGWLGRGDTAVAKGDIPGARRAADAVLATGGGGEAVLGVWRKYAKVRIENLDGKGLEAACHEAKQAGLGGAEEAGWWIQFGQAAATSPHENAAEVIRAADAALAAADDREAVLGFLREYVRGRIEKLDVKGLEGVCVAAKKAGLTQADEAAWWIQFGEIAAAPPHENAAQVIRAADAALAAGAEAATVAPLRARGLLLEAWALQASGDVERAIDRVFQASQLDESHVQTALRQTARTLLRNGVVSKYRGQFDQAVAREDWQEALRVAGAAQALDKASSAWMSKAVRTSPPAALNSLPPAALASLPPAALASLPVAALVALPPLRNSIGIELKLLPAGSFKMGQAGGESDERPHVVALTQPFYVGVTEVTNAQWKAVMGSVPSNWQDDARPVEQISWGSAVEFCRKLSVLPEEHQAGRVYRLPTEAEWEYACRAGTTTQWSFGDDERLLSEYGWFVGNSFDHTHPVGQKKANPWGLYDMHGNVWEYCSDWHQDYPSGPVTDPQGGSGVADSHRVDRGGGWFSNARNCRSADRWCSPSYPSGVGFRLALSLPGREPPDVSGE